jgi:hypothetical protein
VKPIKTFEVAFLAILGLIALGYGSALLAASNSDVPALWWPASVGHKILGLPLLVYGIVWCVVGLINLSPIMTGHTRIPFLAATMLGLFWGWLSVWWAVTHHYQPGAWGVPSIYLGAAALIWVTAAWSRTNGASDG